MRENKSKNKPSKSAQRAAKPDVKPPAKKPGAAKTAAPAKAPVKPDSKSVKPAVAAKHVAPPKPPVAPKSVAPLKPNLPVKPAAKPSPADGEIRKSLKELSKKKAAFFDDDDSDDDDFVEDNGEGDEDMSLNVSLTPVDTSERIILVVDEEGVRRNETMAIVTQILPNAVIEAANDPEEALGMMTEGDFDTYVVNFLMPGYSSSPFVKAVANHPEHPLLIGFAADKMSDALDPKKGLKIIPLKRLFDLDASAAVDPPEIGVLED